MPTLRELDQCYMASAISHAKLSKAKRKQVGACLVTSSGVIIPGYNGTPTGSSNECEELINGVLVTKPEVIHAELNCILKAAREGVSIVGSRLYVTLSPCKPCAAMIVQAGVKEVVYLQTYRCTGGLSLLVDAGVEVRQIV